jgi:hypothetical protein
LKDDQFYELYSRRKNVLEQISSNKAYKKWWGFFYGMCWLVIVGGIKLETLA